MNKATFSIFSALLADYIMVTIIVPIINDLFKIDYGEIDQFRVGFVFSMKGFTQLCMGLLIGKISDKLQLKLMIQLGLFSDLITSFIYIFGRKFPCYMAARGFHGVGSALIASSSFSLLANIYKTDKERGEIMSKAGSGIAFGVLSGPVVGGLLYSVGEQLGLGTYARLVPFACCSLILILSIITIHFFIPSPYTSKKKFRNASLNKKSNKKVVNKNLSNWEILKYLPILSLVYLSFVGNLETAYVEPILPNYWMKLTENHWNTTKSGILFAFSPLSYTIFMPILGKHGYKVGRHYIVFFGTIIISSIVLIILPTKDTIYLSAIFLFIMGFGSGAIDGSLQPMLAQAYDNLLERKEKSKTFSSIVEMDISDEISEDSTNEYNNYNKNNKNNNKNNNNDISLDIISKELNKNNNNNNNNNIDNNSDNDDDNNISVNINNYDSNSKLRSENESNIQIKEIKNNEDEDEEDDDDEESHNKYTRVFSLGNMAMNVGFIAGPMISSFFTALIHGDEPNVNRFNSPFFKCCLIFAIFGFISSFVALIPGMKKYRNTKKA
ncbi:MFS general substrate transporter [Anaeromyces robustus]|uniref:MFS general substrate transporter n=1 Tax=Anaeromyces robustus TaxID=1754192 RepID=A0A1Y1W5P1_9FUNG|nr:MFS general substrate transporter [Anaeromyces robustus]|eukprot:ORX68861.1 MFS general substrate transporter [Anaeromyces robustus]